MRERYKLLKDVHWGKAGTIIEARCDDGTQDFLVVDLVGHENLKNLSYDVKSRINVNREIVENSPEFFEEVVLFYIPKNMIGKVQKLLGIK